jgi:lysophospholipase L1-like esterase
MSGPIRVLLALVPALAMLPVAEIGLRAGVPDVEIRTPLARGGFLRPYVPGAQADLVSSDFRVRYAIDEHGFRDVSGRTIRPEHPDRFRVLLFGDSFTEGFGVEQADSYARRLEAADPNDYEVWNLGRMGASPLFHVVMAREFVPRLAPDLVVVQLFDNDLDENRFRHLPREADGRVGALPDRMRPRTGAAAWLGDAWDGLALVQAFDRLERRLGGKDIPRLFVRVGSHVNGAAPGPPSPDRLFPWYDPARTADWEPKLAEEEVLLRQLVSELRASGTRVLLVYVPHMPELVPGDPAASRARNPHAQRIARVATELGVPLLDAIDVFAAPGRVPAHYYFERDQHWNAAGHALFAEALRTTIEDLGSAARMRMAIP